MSEKINEGKLTVPLHKANFRAEWLTDEEGGDIVLSGYTDGGKWNGWERPSFTLEVMRELMQAIEERAEPDLEMETLTENPDGSFTVWENPREPIGNIDATICETEDGKIPLYDMGGQWTWEIVE